MNWIEFKERMPEVDYPGKELNVKTPKGDGVAIFATKLGFYRIRINGVLQPDGLIVTHWCPLHND